MMLAVSLILAVPSAAATSGHVPNRDGGIERRLSRYQRIALRPRPDQRDLLAAVGYMDFGDEIQTVGDAIAALVDGSGYRLMASSPGSCQNRLLELPLPSVHRHLGPLSLRQALAVLSGPAWRLWVDRVSRFLWFERVSLNEEVDRGACRCD